MRPPALPLDQLPRIDVVLVTHNHYDHLDLRSLQWLARERRPLSGPTPGNQAWLETRGVADAHYGSPAQFTANYPAITPAMTYDLPRIEREYQASAVALARNMSGRTPSPDRIARALAIRKDYQEKLNLLPGPEVATAYAQRNRPGPGG